MHLSYRQGDRHTVASSRGFTIVEMLVSISLFTVVVLVAVGALTTVTTANKKVQSVRTVMDNLNFATESLARSLRAGQTYHCGTTGTLTDPNDCTSSGESSMAFQSEDGRTFVIRQNGTVLQKSTDGGSAFLDITSPDVEISNVQFFVSGATLGDSRQPRVLFVVEGTAGIRDADKTDFRLQTTVTQRIISN